jgi:hypothetical protein
MFEPTKAILSPFSSNWQIADALIYLILPSSKRFILYVISKVPSVCLAELIFYMT